VDVGDDGDDNDDDDNTIKDNAVAKQVEANGATNQVRHKPVPMANPSSLNP
jgi:hypothetical protein